MWRMCCNAPSEPSPGRQRPELPRQCRGSRLHCGRCARRSGLRWHDGGWVERLEQRAAAYEHKRASHVEPDQDDWYHLSGDVAGHDAPDDSSHDTGDDTGDHAAREYDRAGDDAAGQRHVERILDSLTPMSRQADG